MVRWSVLQSSVGSAVQGLAVLCFARVAVCDQWQSVTYREFPVPGIFHFFGGIRNGIVTNWYRKKVSEPVSEKFGTGKKSRDRYRKNLIPELICVAKI